MGIYATLPEVLEILEVYEIIGLLLDKLDDVLVVLATLAQQVAHLGGPHFIFRGLSCESRNCGQTLVVHDV